MSQRTKAVAVAVLTGASVWLGLSPRVAKHLYTRALLPRCRPKDEDTCNKVGGNIEPVNFRSGDHILHGHVHRGDNARLVLYFGGRRSNRQKNRLRAEAIRSTGWSVFTFTPSGFGDAEGRANLKTLLEDGLSAYDAALTLGYDSNNIVLYGESLGAAVAAYVSSLRPAAGLILQSGFGSLQAQLKDMVPFLRLYPRFMFSQPKLSSADYLRNGHPDLLIIHGEKDRVIDKKHSHWLAKASGSGTRLIILPGGDHANLYSREDWLEVLRDFLGCVS